MATEGWYYLHTNGSLIYKRELGGTRADLAESDFVRSVWPYDPSRRQLAWDTLVEAASLGADPARIAELAKHWKCDDADAEQYAREVGVTLRHGQEGYVARTIDGGTSSAGAHPTALAALADLCANLGFTGRCTWSATFEDLCRPRMGRKAGDMR